MDSCGKFSHTNQPLNIIHEYGMNYGNFYILKKYDFPKIDVTKTQVARLIK